ncbi:ABC transporter ATP-binding protein [Pseudomonas sp. ABC1]|uniref:ABC transporter ATP-binding protein n=1 Tax=Pseudomonas sp. ABC1 TaxID=2748080 RepID=UPI0015C333C7|nr:ABC transporter ATP-binding protein [Pseudomonas sp. ABC1]QLF93586.1 ABC transporter ATP-binding protein [Pseudomonas sp. ABC1]
MSQDDILLECRELGWRVKGTPIIQGISLALRRGETLGLIGPNGSGKSTLLKVLAGLRTPSAGELYLQGQPMTRLPRRQVAQRLAFVEQHAETAESICVRDAVELGRTPWLSALQPWSAEDSSIVAEALAAVGMGHMRDRVWNTLSGGERQRVHIARALAQQPELLLLDEPTNHLDIQHQIAILGLVHQLPVTALIALHDLNQALGCDRVGVMAGGRLVALGAPEEVLTPDCLRQVFGVEARYLTDPYDGSRVIRFQPLTAPRSA